MIKTATGVADADGLVVTDEVPEAAVLGTFWAFSEGHELRSMTAGWHEGTRTESVESACTTPLELLRANPTRQVTLELDKAEVSGRVVEVLEASSEDRAKLATDTALRSAAPGAAFHFDHVDTSVGSELVVLETNDKGRRILPVSAVRSLSGKELTTRCHATHTIATREKRLSFDLGPAAAKQPVKLRILYFTSGLRWIPTYRVDTSIDAKADLQLQGEILNEEEDFEHAAIDLVVGVPHFKFKDVPSPMGLEQVMRQALAQAAPMLMNQQMSNVLFTQRSGERYRNDSDGSDAESSAMSMAPELSGEAKQDLFVYSVKSLSLKKGSRAAVSLWRNTVPRRDLYTLNLPIKRNGRDPGSDSNSPQQLSENQVWHQIELSNTSKVPWTTGSLLIMQGDLPVAQELLTYTSAGGKVLVPETIAVNVRATRSETMTEHTPGKYRQDGVDFAIVKKDGAVTVTNHERFRVPMRVSIGTGGKVEKASDGAKVSLDDLHSDDWSASPVARVNQHSDVVWEFELAPGETRTVTYHVSMLE